MTKTLGPRVLWICVAVLALGLGCRLIWRASCYETGFQTLGLAWRDATWGWIAGRYEPIQNREPRDQAEFWVAESDRVLAKHDYPADMCLGAAVVMDGPSPEFFSRYLAKRSSPSLGISDFDRLSLATLGFERSCKRRRKELGLRGVMAEPDSVQRQRTWAELQCRTHWGVYLMAPQDADFVEILDECKRHDSGNALYDYLAAAAIWHESAEIGFLDGDRCLVVKDAKQYQLALDRFSQAQGKPSLSFGETSPLMAASFLHATRAPLADQAKILQGCDRGARRIVLLKELWRWQDLRARKAMADGDVESGVAIHRQIRRLFDQFESAGPAFVCDSLPRRIRVETAGQFRKIAKDHRAERSPEEIREIDDQVRSAKLKDKIYQQALSDVAEMQNEEDQSGRSGVNSQGLTPWNVFLSAVDSISPGLVVVLFVAGIIGLALGRSGKGRELPRLGALVQIALLTAAAAMTVVVFGFAPGQVIPERVQNWGITLLLVLSPLVLLGWAVWKWFKFRSFQFHLKEMLIWMFGLCLMMGLVSMMHPSAESFKSLPFQLAIPPRGWGGMGADVVEFSFRSQPRWLWVVEQWLAYQGPYLSIALWMFFVAVVHWRKQRAGTMSERMGAICRTFGNACLTLGAVLLVLYLAVAPEAVADAEFEYQRTMFTALHPNQPWLKVQAAAERVQANAELMDQIRKAVEEEMTQAE